MYKKRPALVILLTALSVAALVYAVKAGAALRRYNMEIAGSQERALLLEEELARRQRRLEFILNKLDKETSSKKKTQEELDSLLRDKRDLEAKLQEYDDRLKRGEPEIVVITKQFVSSGGSAPAAQSVMDGKILRVDKAGSLVEVNLGVANGIKRADILSVYRDNIFVGSIRADKIEEEKCVACILPGWRHAEFRENDAVKMR